jgi:O-antigen/teichoic acid export membrane protein
MNPAAASGSFLGRAGPLVVARLCASVVTACIPLVLARMMDLSQYGTYKQLFLISQTLSYVLPLGMAQALYFFIPRADVKRPYFVQTLAFLTVMGAIAAAALIWLEGRIASAFSNPELPDYRVEQSVYLACWMASYTLEISLTSQGKTRQAALVYLVSDALRAAAMIIPAALGYGVKGVMTGAALLAVVRYAAAWIAMLFSGAGPMFDRRLFVSQLAYALPFGAAMLVAIPQQYAHQFVVSSTVAPAAFAIYAVGCFQLPIVDMLYTPTTEVLMVRVGELEKLGRIREGVLAFREAAAKLALAFFPLGAFFMAAAPEFIAALFGPNFAAATPLFRISLLGVALAVFPLDGVLRARGQTRHLLASYAVKAAVTVPLLLVVVKAGYGMLGAISAWALAEVCGKAMLFARVPRALSDPGAPVSASQCIPWVELGRAALASTGAACAVIAIRTPMRMASAWPKLVVASAVFAVGYLAMLRLVGLRPLNVLQSLRPSRAQ